MKHSNIYEKCHNLFGGYNSYYIIDTTVQTFGGIIHINHNGYIHPSITIKRDEV